MNSEKAIENILKEQVKSYALLHELLIKEKACLVKVKPQKVEEISKEKDTVVMRLRLLEEERQRLIETIVDEYGIEGSLNLEELGRISGNDIFYDLREKLRTLIHQVSDMNKVNSILIERSLKHIRTTASFFNTFSIDGAADKSGVLLSKET